MYSHNLIFQGTFPVGHVSVRGRGWDRKLGLKRGSRSYAFLANSLYKVGNCYYQTDNACARVKRVYGKIVKDKADRHKSAQRAVGKLARARGDDGGHIIASRFQGSGQAINMVPMSATINRRGGAWYRMEEDIEHYLRLGYEVTIDVVLHYIDDTSLRPSSFEVIISFNGEQEAEYRIDNPL